MGLEPRMRLPDTHARYQKRAILAGRVEALSIREEQLDKELEELSLKKIVNKGKQLIDKVIPGEQSTEKKKRLAKEAAAKKKKSPSKKTSSSQKKKGGNTCHDPRTGKFCKGRKAGSKFNKVTKPSRVEVINTEESTNEEIIKKMLNPKAAYQITAADGTVLKISDVDGLLDKEHAELMLTALAYNHEKNPLSPPAEIILMKKYSLGGGIIGWVYNLPGFKNKIHLSYDALESSFPKEPGGYESGSDYMPASRYEGDDEDNPTTKTEYAVAHEYGHIYDFSKNRGSAKALYNGLKGEWDKESNTLGGYPWKTPYAEMSEYGKSSPAEAYGEAYAEWMLTSGRTTNEPARAYAAYEKWPGYNQDNGKPVQSYNRD